MTVCCSPFHCNNTLPICSCFFLSSHKRCSFFPNMKWRRVKKKNLYTFLTFGSTPKESSLSVFTHLAESTFALPLAFPIWQTHPHIQDPMQEPGCGCPEVVCCHPSGTFSILIPYHPSLALTTPTGSHCLQKPASDPESTKDKDVPGQAWVDFSSCSKDSKLPFSEIQSFSTHL